jgi:hypothetical protein
VAIETVGEKTGEVGPVYDVELIDSLPLGDGGGMRQAMPSRKDLERALGLRYSYPQATRVVAGYEVLLNHYHRLVAEVAELKGEKAEGEDSAEADTPSPAIIRWRAAMGRLRKTLGLNDGADVVALLEAAADVCENVASCDPSET